MHLLFRRDKSFDTQKLHVNFRTTLFRALNAAYSLNFLPTCCLETSVRNYHYTLRNSPKERSSHLSRSGSPKSLIHVKLYFVNRSISLLWWHNILFLICSYSATARKPDTQPSAPHHTVNLKTEQQIRQAATNCIILSSS